MSQGFILCSPPPTQWALTAPLSEVVFTWYYIQ